MFADVMPDVEAESLPLPSAMVKDFHPPCFLIVKKLPPTLARKDVDDLLLTDLLVPNGYRIFVRSMHKNTDSSIKINVLYALLR